MSNTHDLNAAEFGKALRANHDAILLDVRTPEEFEQGHLPGALNIDIRGNDFHEQIEDLDHSKAYFVYCRSGARSAAACSFMISKGFPEVHNLLGGIMAWDGEVE